LPDDVLPDALEDFSEEELPPAGTQDVTLGDASSVILTPANFREALEASLGDAAGYFKQLRDCYGRGMAAEAEINHGTKVALWLLLHEREDEAWEYYRKLLGMYHRKTVREVAPEDRPPEVNAEIKAMLVQAAGAASADDQIGAERIVAMISDVLDRKHGYRDRRELALDELGLRPDQMLVFKDSVAAELLEFLLVASAIGYVRRGVPFLTVFDNLEFDITPQAKLYALIDAVFELSKATTFSCLTDGLVERPADHLVVLERLREVTQEFFSVLDNFYTTYEIAIAPVRRGGRSSYTPSFRGRVDAVERILLDGLCEKISSVRARKADHEKMDALAKELAETRSQLAEVISALKSK
jgi:hypothetical protein